MKVTSFAAALLATGLASGAAAAVDSFPTGVSLPLAVRLADGSALLAGPYDVQIHYKGFGNEAELWFLQGGVLKGKLRAEARGFPTTAPLAGPAGEAFPKIEGKVDKLDVAGQKGGGFDKMDGSERMGGRKVQDEATGKIVPGTARASFSWGAYGFNPGLKGKTAPSGRFLRLSFDSANGPSGFNALLPFIEKQVK